MQTVFIEAEHNFNWGKFCVARFDAEEWSRMSSVSGSSKPLLGQRGWGEDHVWVMDLETCEGAGFSPGGMAKYDLDKHNIWVCPMFLPFLEWLYKQDLRDLTKLPTVVKFSEKDAPGALRGYRRQGHKKPDAAS